MKDMLHAIRHGAFYGGESTNVRGIISLTEHIKLYIVDLIAHIANIVDAYSASIAPYIGDGGLCQSNAG